MPLQSVGDYRYDDKEIGRGAFGTVFQGYLFQDETTKVAIKVINLKTGEARRTAREIMDREEEILKDLSSASHNNLVKLLYSKMDEHNVYLVMEFCNGGDFREYLLEYTTLKESVIRQFFGQIGRGLKYLHEKKIVHRNLKPENILLCFVGRRYPAPEKIVLKIAELGLGRILSPDGIAETNRGAMLYKAPEIQKRSHNEKVDIWSIGIMIFECLVGTSEAKRLRKLAYPENSSSEIRNLLENLVIEDPNQRFSCDQFLNHPFICENTIEMAVSVCDVCQENAKGGNEEILIATLHCVDCDENQCADCSREHKRQRLFKHHQIVELDCKLKEKLDKVKKAIISTDKQTTTVCDQCIKSGRHAIATVYCTGCNENQCNTCSEALGRENPCKEHKVVTIAERLNPVIETTTISNPDKLQNSLIKKSGKNLRFLQLGSHFKPK